MSYTVKGINISLDSNEFNDAIEKVQHPSPAIQERRSSRDADIDTDSNSSITFVQSTLALIPTVEKKGLWSKTKAALGYNLRNYQIILLQEQDGRETLGHVLYMGDDASEALIAFEDLNKSLSPLLQAGSFILNDSLLKEIVLPKPLSTTQLSFHLVEVMESDPRAHPKWHKVLQVLLHNACARDNRDEIKFLVEKGGELDQEDYDGNTPIHTAAASVSKEGMEWLLSLAAPVFPLQKCITTRHNSLGESPLDIATRMKNVGAARTLMMKQAMPESSQLDLYTLNEHALELHNAVDDDNSEKIWDYCKKTGLMSVHVRGRRKAVNLKRSPLLQKQQTIDIRVKDGVTPLILAIENQYIKSTLFLLLGGADPNQHHPDSGDTPLHYAVRKRNVTLVKMLLVFGADPTLCNNERLSPLHVSKKNDYNSKNPITVVLEEMTALQERTWNYFINNLELPPCQDEDEVYLLAMDGGGIRSFNLCQAIIAIEDRMKQLQSSCKPFFSYFDYVSGTSAGAIVSLVNTYTDVTASVSRALVYKIVTDVFAMPKAERGYLTEKYLKELLGEDTTMADVTEPKVIIMTTLGDRSPSQLHIMTNYSDARDDQKGPSERKVWEAARASSAAPYFFPVFEGKFLDGGLMANNPTLDAMVEIQSQAEKEGVPVKMGCVVSLGTGFAPVKPVENIDVFIPGLSFKAIASLQGTISGLRSLLDLFVSQVTQSNGQEVQRAQAWCKSLDIPYFRFSPPLTEQIDLLSFDEEAIINMLYDDQKYILACPEIIDSIAKCLLTKKQT